jgi:nitroreductase
MTEEIANNHDPGRIDDILATTRAVRRRLDFSRGVEPRLIRDCIDIAAQAPTKRNHQHWRFVVVSDEHLRFQLASIYRESWYAIDRSRHESYSPEDLRSKALPRVLASARYLADNLHRVPILVIPCVAGRIDRLATHSAIAAEYASVFPAVWSFMLAARSRGLGSVLTTTHLAREADAAALLGIPFESVSQTCMIPIAHFTGTTFARGKRRSLEEMYSWDRW